MCIPHARNRSSVSFEKKERRERKSVAFDKEAIEHGDPDFVDERKTAYVPEKKDSFFEKLFK